MKALTIKEPWASMIRDGLKTIETRTWKTKYRGPLLLTASKKPPSSISGMAFAVANLIDCRKMMSGDEGAACCEVYPGSQAWIFDDVRPIEPFPIRGSLGIFTINSKSSGHQMARCGDFSQDQEDIHLTPGSLPRTLIIKK